VVARDLLYDRNTNKQFIRVQTREGSSYFLIIDYDKPLDEAGDSYETYFLNMVDARDLLDVIDEADVPERFKATTPAPTEVPMPTPQPTAVPPEQTPEPAPVPPPAQTGGSSGGIVILLLLAGGGGAVWYFKFRIPQEKGKRKSVYDDFDMEDEEYDEDDEQEEADGDDA